jgi:hypothetical protein
MMALKTIRKRINCFSYRGMIAYLMLSQVRWAYKLNIKFSNDEVFGPVIRKVLQNVVGESLFG